MLRSLVLCLALVGAVPPALAAPTPPRSVRAGVRYHGLERLLRKFSRQAGDAAARGKIYAQR